MSNFGSTTVQWVVFAAAIALAIAVMGGRWLSSREAQRGRTIYGISTVVEAVFAHVHANRLADDSNLESLMADSIRKYVVFQLAVNRLLARTVADYDLSRGRIEEDVHRAFVAALTKLDHAEQSVAV